MHERLPVDVRLAAAVLVAPLDELEVVLDRMLAVPVDPLVVGDAGFLVRAQISTTQNSAPRCS
jgi:hypothetical protein